MEDNKQKNQDLNLGSNLYESIAVIFATTLVIFGVILILADFGFGLDTTIAYDVPTAAPHEKITELGKGVAIKVMDSSTICDYRMVQYMKELAKKHKIKHQLEILTGGGTDTAGIQRMNPGGSIAGAVSIPTRHIHQVIEMADKTDIRSAINLLHYSVKGLNKYDWSFKHKTPV